MRSMFLQSLKLSWASLCSYTQGTCVTWSPAILLHLHSLNQRTLRACHPHLAPCSPKGPVVTEQPLPTAGPSCETLSSAAWSSLIRWTLPSPTVSILPEAPLLQLVLRVWVLWTQGQSEP